MNAPAEGGLLYGAGQSPGHGYALSARGLAYAYDGAAPVFADVAIDIRHREIVCLLGGSGCGKSSLLRVLSRLEA